jgi:uncharacterized protein YlxW (UPF0749 family)
MVDQESPSPAEGLLEQIADTALDDDYYVVRTGHEGQVREFNTVLTGCVLAVFALLVTIAALQTRSDRPATERERATLITDVDARKKLLAGREDTVDKLRKEVADLSSSVGALNPKYEALRVQTGDRAATGPGVTVTASPSISGNDDGNITDGDLQMLVNGLWYAGAEAVAVNGHRIGTLSSIRAAGGAINVNYKDIGPPYFVEALGDSATLSQRFSDNPAGRYWAERRDNAGVRFDVTPSSQLTVPAAPPDRMTVTHATAIKGER